MKDFMSEVKDFFNDSDYRGLLRFLKWVTIILLVGAGGFLGFLLALVLVFAWRIPPK